MSIEVRSLCADDIFSVCQILSDIGFTELHEKIKKSDLPAMLAEGASTTSIGMAILVEIVSMVLANLSKCREHLYTFLGSVSGMSESDIGKLPMGTFASLVISVFQDESIKECLNAVLDALRMPVTDDRG